VQGTARARSAAAILIGALSLIATSGCAAGTAEEASGSSQPAPTVAEVVTIPMPDLGPRPSSEPLSDIDAERKRVELADGHWDTVIAQYPDAVRPEVAFQGFIALEAHFETMRTCLEDAGVEIAIPTSAEGEPAGFEIVEPTVETSIAYYACEVSHPVRPSAEPSDAELGWAYDYLTRFVVPCYEANGIENEPAPPREEWVAVWPEYLWMPSTGDLPLDPERQAAIDEACPWPDAASGS
jgi:hypothetical protein